LSKVADQLISTKKSGRKSKQELIVEQILNHNKKETVRSSRIKTDEIAALKNVVVMSDWAQRRLKVIWQSQLPPYSSVPITLLASRFLSPTQEVKVNKDEKPVWLDILGYSTSKSDAWLARIDGRFNNLVTEMTAKGKKPNLQNQAAQYRDTGHEDMVWMMSCVKVWAWALAAQNNTAERMKELEACWRRGALDDSLRDHVVLMKATFKASDLPWVSAVFEGIGAFSSSSVDPHGQNQEELSHVQKESLHAAFKEWVKVLSIEEGRYKLWKTEKDAWDSTCAVKLQKWRNDRGFIKESGVKELCETWYNAQGFDKKDGVETWIGQQMTKIADLHPARPQSQILRLMYVDMAALGLNHSRVLPDLVGMIKSGCENHPETFSAFVVLPNTPSYGKGLNGKGRDKNICSAIKDTQLP
jgi:hypothetical protein